MQVGDLVKHKHIDTLGLIISYDEWCGDWLVLFGDGKKMWAAPRWMEVISASR
jgi:hypothetical protein